MSLDIESDGYMIRTLFEVCQFKNIKIPHEVIFLCCITWNSLEAVVYFLFEVTKSKN